MWARSLLRNPMAAPSVGCCWPRLILCSDAAPKPRASVSRPAGVEDGAGGSALPLSQGWSSSQLTGPLHVSQVGCVQAVLPSFQLPSKNRSPSEQWGCDEGTRLGSGTSPCRARLWQCQPHGTPGFHPQAWDAWQVATSLGDNPFAH